jgi:hypothetical protein
MVGWINKKDGKGILEEEVKEINGYRNGTT